MADDLFLRRAVVQVDDFIFRSEVNRRGLVGLDFAFEITRTTNPEPNTAQLSIWNLAASRRSAITQLQNVPVKISAGYLSADPTLLFPGRLERFENLSRWPRYRTGIVVGDGERAFRTARTSRSWGQNTNVREVVEQVAEDLGLGRGNLSSFTELSLEGIGRTFAEGLTAFGPSIRELKRLAASTGLEVSIQNNALQFAERGQAIPGAPVLLSPRSGLLSAPEKSPDGIVRAVALIQPGLEPGRAVEFDSESVQGLFRIETSRAVGGTASNSWQIEIECNEI